MINFSDSLLESQKTKEGGYNVLLFDVYDFETLDMEPNNFSSMTLFNNIAVELQDQGEINNYYIILSIEFSEKEIKEILK